MPDTLRPPPTSQPRPLGPAQYPVIPSTGGLPFSPAPQPAPQPLPNPTAPAAAPQANSAPAPSLTDTQPIPVGPQAATPAQPISTPLIPGPQQPAEPQPQLPAMPPAPAFATGPQPIIGPPPASLTGQQQLAPPHSTYVSRSQPIAAPASIPGQQLNAPLPPPPFVTSPQSIASPVQQPTAHSQPSFVTGPQPIAVPQPASLPSPSRAPTQSLSAFTTGPQPIAAPQQFAGTSALPHTVPDTQPLQPPSSGPTALPAGPLSIARPMTATLAVMPLEGEPPPSSYRGYNEVQSQRGRYLIGREVGAGAFGSVFECLGPFDQRYALKVLRPSGRPIVQVRAEWTREVQRLQALRHPNVVYIHDAFEWQGNFCVALEWCDHTLKDMLERPLGEELAIELLRQMLAGVQYLHDNDLVHDDLHAGNVLIQQADRPLVKISDFGISHELRGAHAVRPEVVHHAIMAPELLAVGYTSKQSDLYQIGLIMYSMITGESPIQLDVPYPYLVKQIAEGLARQRAEQLGTPFGAIVAKLLRRRDAYRYTSAREVWADLRNLPAWRSRQLFPIR